MTVLFDHNVPKKLRTRLPGHALRNGDLLIFAEANGFDAMVTGDKNISYQQNLEARKPAVIVLPTTDWELATEPSPHHCRVA